MPTKKPERLPRRFVILFITAQSTIQLRARCPEMMLQRQPPEKAAAHTRGVHRGDTSSLYHYIPQKNETVKITLYRRCHAVCIFCEKIDEGSFLT